jgi:hypothetical protein
MIKKNRMIKRKYGKINRLLLGMTKFTENRYNFEYI